MHITVGDGPDGAVSVIVEGIVNDAPGGLAVQLCAKLYCGDRLLGPLCLLTIPVGVPVLKL
jgi:hypothetical protein